jgi:DinB superfamily
MNAHDIIRYDVSTADMICMGLVSDLSDADLMRRPAPGCNHINWQLGHLITSDHEMLGELFPNRLPPLPSGFAARYDRDRVGSDDPGQFSGKDELLKVYREQRAAALGILEGLTAEDLAKPAPEKMRSYAPTVGCAFALLGSHWLMHCGQWSVVRRQMGLPPLF